MPSCWTQAGRPLSYAPWFGLSGSGHGPLGRKFRQLREWASQQVRSRRTWTQRTGRAELEAISAPRFLFVLLQVLWGGPGKALRLIWPHPRLNPHFQKPVARAHESESCGPKHVLIRMAGGGELDRCIAFAPAGPADWEQCLGRLSANLPGAFGR